MTVGVAVLVTMVSIGEGAEEAVLQHFHSMGTDLVVASAGKVVIVAGRARQTGNVTTLTVQDAEALGTGLEHIRQAAPVQSQKLPVKWQELPRTFGRKQYLWRRNAARRDDPN